MSEKMKIREATPEDIPSIKGFQQNLARETENITLDDSQLSKGLASLFQDRSKGQYYIAETEGKIVGCLMTTFEWSEWRNGNVLWIQSVYVAQEYRGRGVYKEMYSHVQNIVTNDGSLRGIRLYAEKNNVSAQAVYSKMGMDGDHYLVFEWMK